MTDAEARLKAIDDHWEEARKRWWDAPEPGDEASENAERCEECRGPFISEVREFHVDAEGNIFWFCSEECTDAWVDAVCRAEAVA